jgi:hypothetical protein
MTDERHGTQGESVPLNWSCGFTGLQLAPSSVLTFGYRRHAQSRGPCRIG